MVIYSQSISAHLGSTISEIADGIHKDLNDTKSNQVTMCTTN